MAADSGKGGRHARSAVLGIDVGGSSVKVGWVDPSQLQLIGRRVQEDLPADAAGRTPEVVTAAVHAAVDRLDVSLVAAAVGIGFPGIVRDGRVVAAAHFPAWKDVVLADLVRGHARLPAHVPIAAANDANAAAAGEAARCPDRVVVVVSLGTGVGVGVAVGGRPLPRNIEAGHHILVPGGRPCACGQRGCWESYCSAPALLASTPVDAAYASCEQVFRDAKVGLEPAVALVQAFVERLAQGCVNLARMFDPEDIVLAGGIASAGDWLRDQLVQAMRGMWWTSVPTGLPDVRIAEVGCDAGIVGAAAAARAGDLPLALPEPRKRGRESV